MYNQWRMVYIVAVFACLPLAHLNAQPTLHGELTGVLGPGTYVVDGNCSVPVGQRLEILPGTTFLHCGLYIWLIYGELSAVGTEAETIRFIRQNPIYEHNWGGLWFGVTAEGSILRWCEFDHTRHVLHDGGAIYLDRVSVTISNCTISNCFVANNGDGGGIYAYSVDSLVIDSCVIVNNTSQKGGGILIESCNNVTISNCYIGNNYSTYT